MKRDPQKTPLPLGENKMSFDAFAFLFLIALCMAAANLLLRGSLSRVPPFALSLQWILGVLRQPLFISGMVLVGAAGLMWCRALLAGGLMTIYPIFVALTFVLITIGSTLFLGERLSVHKVLGTVMILGGIFFATRL